MPRSSARRATADTHELVDRCVAGKDDAWAELVDRYGDLIYSVALRTGASRSDAEEIFQTTVLAIYQGLRTLRDPERLVSWIAGVARRQALTFFRKRAREVDEGDGLPEEVDPGALSDDVLASLERAQHVQEALSTLRERCRVLLHALYLREPPADYETVCAETGIPIGSIGPTRARCLEALRAALEASGWEAEGG
jgi:RNA polymerase sigma factor (sigma-70 family)